MEKRNPVRRGALQADDPGTPGTEGSLSSSGSGGFDDFVRVKNPFDLGYSENFEEVFGSEGWAWLLPVHSTPGDGTYFRTRSLSSSVLTSSM
tara:strand:- start:550 stop:825 length:276 start_codon:yes stop_codon:yes gene_type:complete